MPSDDAPRDSHADLIRDYLADRDANCPSCGYNLRGGLRDRCPECDVVVTPRVTVAALPSGPLILAVMGPAMAAGCNLTLLIAIWLGGLLSPGVGATPGILGALFAAAGVNGVFLMLCLQNYREYDRRFLGGMKYFVAACWLPLLFQLGVIFFRPIY